MVKHLMKASDILDKVSSVRPNPYGSYLGDYLKSLDIRIRTDIFGEIDPVYSEDSLALTDKDFALYELFLFSVIDLLNGEYGRYQNSRDAFETAYSELLAKNTEAEGPGGNPDANPDSGTDKEPGEGPYEEPEASPERSFKIW